MALSISGATIGYDTGNVGKLLTKLNTKCISETKTKMNNGLLNGGNSLIAYTQDAWVGKSADIFMDNMKKDYNYVCKKLDEAYNNLQAEFNAIIKEMKNYDETLVSKRDGGVM